MDKKASRHLILVAACITAFLTASLPAQASSADGESAMQRNLYRATTLVAVTIRIEANSALPAIVYHPEGLQPELSVTTPDIQNADQIAGLISEDVLAAYAGMPGITRSIQIAIATDGVETYAIALPMREEAWSQQRTRVYKVETTESGAQGVTLMMVTDYPFSSGMSVDTQDIGGKVLVAGVVAGSHYAIAEDRVLDLSNRSHIVADGAAGSASMSVVSQEALVGFICILDSPFTDLTLYDIDGNALLRLSERPNEFVIRAH